LCSYGALGLQVRNTLEECHAHNLKVAGSNPAPATKKYT
jgi:hypothetical protein